jgi:hypothetical protein
VKTGAATPLTAPSASVRWVLGITGESKEHSNQIIRRILNIPRYAFLYLHCSCAFIVTAMPPRFHVLLCLIAHALP